MFPKHALFRKIICASPNNLKSYPLKLYHQIENSDFKGIPGPARAQRLAVQHAVPKHGPRRRETWEASGCLTAAPRHLPFDPGHFMAQEEIPET